MARLSIRLHGTTLYTGNIVIVIYVCISLVAMYVCIIKSGVCTIRFNMSTMCRQCIVVYTMYSIFTSLIIILIHYMRYTIYTAILSLLQPVLVGGWHTRIAYRAYPATAGELSYMRIYSY